MIRRILLLLPACALTASAAPHLLDPRDRARFPAELFPGVESLTIEQLVDLGLRARYPERIRDSDPSLAPGETRPPRTDELPGGHAYVRVHDIASALDAIAAAVGRRSAVLDLRQARGGLSAAAALGRLLALTPGAAIEVVGNVEGGDTDLVPDGRRATTGIVVVLVGPETRGAVEAVLAALASQREIVLVGSQTGGDTGVFTPLGPDGPFVLAGEVVPRGMKSLLGHGLSPLVHVVVPGSEARAVAHALDSGAALADLLDTGVEKPRFDEAALIRGEDPTRSETTSRQRRAPEDRVLQRALAILDALEALGRLGVDSAQPTGRTASRP